MTPAVLLLGTRHSILSGVWVAVVLCCFLFVLAVILGTLFRSRWLWMAALTLIAASLVLGGVAAVMDRLG